MVSYSQTIKENIKKQSRDPKTADHAARADVYILDNKEKISDTITTSTNTRTNTKAIRKKKKSRNS
jgi:hypothetical protein